jgi:hypothetical protein
VKGAEGIRTDDLLHGNQTLRPRNTARLGRQSRVQSGIGAAHALDQRNFRVHEFDGDVLGLANERPMRLTPAAELSMPSAAFATFPVFSASRGPRKAGWPCCPADLRVPITL